MISVDSVASKHRTIVRPLQVPMIVYFVGFVLVVDAAAAARSRIGSLDSTSGVDTLGVATLGVEIGRISVLSSRFFLGLGSGATHGDQ